jgi:hypothetical protein
MPFFLQSSSPMNACRERVTNHRVKVLRIRDNPAEVNAAAVAPSLCTSKKGYSEGERREWGFAVADFCPSFQYSLS